MKKIRVRRVGSSVAVALVTADVVMAESADGQSCTVYVRDPDVGYDLPGEEKGWIMSGIGGSCTVYEVNQGWDEVIRTLYTLFDDRVQVIGDASAITCP